MTTQTKDLTISVPESDDPARWMKPDRSIQHTCERIILKLYDREVSITTRSHDIDGTPEEEWHGRVLTLDVDPQVDATLLADWLESKADLLERVFDGHAVEWNGSDNVGRLTDDARKALDKLEHMLHRPRDGSRRWESDLPMHEIVMWHAGEFLNDWVEELVDDYGITSDTSDDRLREIADEIREEAREEGIKIYRLEIELERIREEQ